MIAKSSYLCFSEKLFFTNDAKIFDARIATPLPALTCKRLKTLRPPTPTANKPNSKNHANYTPIIPRGSSVQYDALSAKYCTLIFYVPSLQDLRRLICQ
jgi:hypothetical protein